MSKRVINFNIEIRQVIGENKLKEVKAKSPERLIKVMPKWMKRSWVKISWIDDSGSDQLLTNKNII